MIPFSSALRDSLSRGYSFAVFRQDFAAALIVSLVALPLAMALSIAVGLPPQHGIYTAIAAGILVPLLGGSAMQVSGPTAAFVVIVAPIVTEFGLRGLVVAQVMAGVMLIILAWVRLGRFIHFVPYPVTTGFTSGIAVVLAVYSLSDLLGLGLYNLRGTFLDKLIVIAGSLPKAQGPEIFLGFLSLAIMMSGKRITRKVPSVLIAIIVATAIGLFFHEYGITYATIGNRFTYQVAGGLGHGIPPITLALYDFGRLPLSFAEVQRLFMPAVVIAALAALESLLSASVADGLSRRRHEPNAELGAIGIGNLVSGMIGGIPATGAIARTTTNIKSGARTPLAAAMHGVFIFLFVWLLAPFISYIPMASLAALLMVTAYNMSHYKQFARIVHIAPRHDVIVLLTCFGLTVFVDMVAGVMVGIMLAMLLFIQRIATVTEVKVEEGAQSDSPLPPGALVYHISGPLFFATVERALDRTAFLRSRIDTIVMDMEEVPFIDMTGLVAIKYLLTGDALAGKRVVLCARDDVSAQIRQKLADEPHAQVSFARTVKEALAMIAPK